MIVTGANPDYSEFSLEELAQMLGTEEGELIRLPRRSSAGPPLLYKAELVQPFVDHGFSLVSCTLSNFNPTPAYLKMSSSEKVKENEAMAVAASASGTTLRPGKGLAPLCWEAILYKPNYGDLVSELRS